MERHALAVRIPVRDQRLLLERDIKRAVARDHEYAVQTLFVFAKKRAYQLLVFD